MKSYRERIAITRYGDQGRMKSERLLSETSICARPKVGAVIFDRDADVRRVREFRAISAMFDNVSFWSIAKVWVSNAFVVYDDDAIYLDGSIDSGAYKGERSAEIFDSFSQVLTESADQRSNQYENEAALLLHNEGGGTWGHFLIQNLPKAVLFLERFPAGKVAIPAGLATVGQSSFADALVAAGVRPEQIIPLEAHVSYFFEEVFLVDPIYDFSAHIPHPFALEIFDSIAMKAASGLAPNIFVERTGLPPERCISNQADIDTILARHAVEKVSAGVTTFQKQVSIWKSAEVGITTLGSDFTNIVFCQPNTNILSLSPDWFGDAFFYHIAIVKGLIWNELRCGHMTTAAKIPHRSNFLVDVELFENMVTTLC